MRQSETLGDESLTENKTPSCSQVYFKDMNPPSEVAFQEMFPTILNIFAVLFILLYGRMLYYRFVLPSGPTPLPIIGNLLALDPVRPPKSIKKWSKIYGPVFTLWIANKPVIFITDYELMKDVLVKHGDMLSGRPRLFVFDILTKGNFGIIMASGDIWKEQKRFTLQLLRDFGLGRSIMEAKILPEAKRLSDFLQQQCINDGQTTLDMHPPLQHCVGNIIASMLFGRTFHIDDPRFGLLRKTVNEDLKRFRDIRVLLLNTFPWLRHIPLFGHFGLDGIRRRAKIYIEFLSEELEAHKEQNNQPGADDEPTDFIAAYLKEMKRREDTGEDMSYFSEWQLKSTMADVFAAGMETTVSTLNWAILAMIKHPNIQQKVKEEIDSTIGRNRLPVLSDRQALPYVMATLSEVQRWGNITPINIPHTNDADFQLGGYTIPKWVEVVPQISALSIDERVFPSPEQFRPERFLEADGKTLAKVDQFAPFSMGKRHCLGESLARAELFLVFVHLLQHFQFHIPPGCDPLVEPDTGVTPGPKPFKTLVMPR